MGTGIERLTIGLPESLRVQVEQECIHRQISVENFITELAESFDDTKEVIFSFERESYEEIMASLLTQTSTWDIKVVRIRQCVAEKIVNYFLSYNIRLFCSVAYLVAAYYFNNGKISVSLSEIRDMRCRSRQTAEVRLDIGMELIREYRSKANSLRFDFPRFISIALLYYRKIDVNGKTFKYLPGSEKTLHGNRKINIPAFLESLPGFSYKGNYRQYVGDALFSYIERITG